MLNNKTTSFSRNASAGPLRRVLLSAALVIVAPGSVIGCARPLAPRSTAGNGSPTTSSAGGASSPPPAAPVNPAAEARARVASLQSELAAVNAALADKSLGPDLRAELEREAARLRQEMETVRIASSSQEQPLAATATPGLNAGQTQRSKAPDLVVRMSGGAEFDLSKQIKRPVVIQFFATWSGPCKKALPELAKLSRDLDGRADVVLIRGSMSEDEAQDAQAAGGQERALTAATDLLRSVGAGALGERVAVDADGSIAARWNIKAVPAIFLIAPDGSVAQSWLGIGKDTYGEIRGAVDTLNPKPAAAPAAPAAQGS